MKQLKVSYRLRERLWTVHHEGLHEICFDHGKYGHRALSCPVKIPQQQKAKVRCLAANRGQKLSNYGGKFDNEIEKETEFGPWIVR